MSIDTDLQITPKRLGLICVDSYCPRCFWYKLKLRFKMPFDMFGGAIWKNLEQAQIAIVNNLIEKSHSLPKEFAPFQNLVSIVEYPRDYRKFRCVHKSGFTLYGEPDAIYELDDGDLAVIDFKTAHQRDGADPLLPMYACQTIGYSYIAEFGLKLGTVSKGGLLYWSCQHPDVIADPKTHYKNGQMMVGFVPQPHEVEIDYDVLDAPIKEALSLWDAVRPPERSPKCRDCKKLDALLQLETDIQNNAEIMDRSLLNGCVNDPRIEYQVRARRLNERCLRLSACQEVMDMEEDLAFSETGMLSLWD